MVGVCNDFRVYILYMYIYPYSLLNVYTYALQMIFSLPTFDTFQIFTLILYNIHFR